MRKMIKVRYEIDGINPKDVEVPEHLVPMVGDYFVPDLETGNGHQVRRREIYADGRVFLFLAR